jgi:pyruvate dehydrogenase (quinone)/pyruvate oxidase
MVFLGNPEYGVKFAPLDFVKFAEACGARGLRIEDPGRCGDQLQEALAWDGPVIVECVVDPHEPPMPSKITKQQAQHLFEALRAGTPNRNRIALQIVKDELDESSFQAAPGPKIPTLIGEAASTLVDAVLHRTERHEERS